jgi:tRNA modification GTPase
MGLATIYAPASGRGPAGIAVIRISGPEAGDALATLTGRRDLVARRMSCVSIRNGAGELIDEGLAVWFPKPASFTGEDVVELHVHGGNAVISEVLEALADCAGLRPAGPGEFCRQAFDNGKLDLTAAEGLADLVNAETAAQRQQALDQMRGQLGRLYENWRIRLIGMLARWEALIDFPEDVLPGDLEREVRREVALLDREIADHLNDCHRGERLRNGVRIAIVGPPNAGKSSIFNVLAKRDAAIVAPTPGTTRDVIEVFLDLGGFPAIIADTAGLRAATDAVEVEGVRRSHQAAASADLKVVVYDGAVWPDKDGNAEAVVDGNTVAIVNKSDLGRIDPAARGEGPSPLPVSALTGDGIDAFVFRLTKEVEARCRGDGLPSLTRIRHRQALVQCRQSLERSLAVSDVELFAEDLRLAGRSLGAITGRVDVEEVLDSLFREFCIGK